MYSICMERLPSLISLRLQALVIANSRNDYKSCKNPFHKASSVASPPLGDVCKKVCQQKHIHGYPRVVSKKQIKWLPKSCVKNTNKYYIRKSLNS